MDVTEILYGAAAALITLLVGVGSYPLYRLKKLERESEARAATESEKTQTELANLRRRATDLEEQAKKVPRLERQLDTVCVELRDVQERLKKAEEALKEANRENEQLRTENTNLSQTVHDLRVDNNDLSSQIKTFIKVLQIFSIEVDDRKKALSGAGAAPVLTTLTVNEQKETLNNESE